MPGKDDVKDFQRLISAMDLMGIQVCSSIRVCNSHMGSIALLPSLIPRPHSVCISLGLVLGLGLTLTAIPITSESNNQVFQHEHMH